MVVGIHTIKTDNLEFETLEDVCTVLLRLILNCAVPLFLAISGYFLGNRNYTYGASHLTFLKHQIPKIYIPCLVFSLPYLFFALKSDTHSLFQSLALYFACGFSVYYFVALIIQYYLLLPLLSKCNRGGVYLCVALSFVSILIVTYLLRILHIDLPLLLYAGPFPVWILFFVMGVYFSKHNRNYSLLLPSLLVIVGFILQIIEYIYWINKGQMALGIKSSSFVFSTGVIWLLFSKRFENSYSKKCTYPIFKVINWIGGISFGIYLLHCHIISLENKFFSHMSWMWSWIFVLSISILVIWIARAMFPGFSKKYLGFR